jgi:TnpA family transposase
VFESTLNHHNDETIDRIIKNNMVTKQLKKSVINLPKRSKSTFFKNSLNQNKQRSKSSFDINIDSKTIAKSVINEKRVS